MTLVKICGITNKDDALAAISAGADYVGIVREPTSSRYVDNPVEIVQVCAGKAVVIGVYGEFYEDEYIQVFDTIQSLSAIDRHEYLRTFRVGETPVENIVKSARGPILLDAFEPERLGGTGKVADWAAAAEAVNKTEVPVFLAGGLTPENVASAISEVKPYAVDVSTGVEMSPGRKDHGKVRAFIEAARGV